MEKKPIRVLITDTHMHKDNIQKVLDVLFQGIDLAAELDVPLSHLGDWFTNRVGQGLEVLMAFKVMLDYAKSKGVKIEAIAGNHDKTNLESEKSYMSVYRDEEGFTLFEKEKFYIDGKIAMCFIPYFKENGSYPERLAKVAKKVKKLKKAGKVDLAFLGTHVAVNGVKNNDGSEVKNRLSKEFFGAFDYTAVGHYHDASTLAGNIEYIGSSYQNNYGENLDKGFKILYDDLSSERVFSKFEKYTNIKIDLSETTLDEIKRLKEEYEGEGNIRFTFKGETSAIESIDLNALREAGIDVKRKTNNQIAAMNSAENSEYVEFDKKEIMKNFKEFTKAKGIEKKKAKFGKKILDRCIH